VAESFSEENGAAARVIQPHSLPVPVTGRADPDIHDHVKDGAADARDVLCLPGGNAGEMDTPDDSAPGYGAVGLRDLRLVPERLG
jgi:hypothetical protein